MIAGVLRRAGTPLAGTSIIEMTEGGLSTMERYWIADSDAALVVPLLDRRGGLLGLILLGEKKSELPFSKEDKDLLTDISAAATETLAQRLLPSVAEDLVGRRSDGRVARVPVSGDSDAEMAFECVDCGQLGPSDLAECPVCGGGVAEALVPRTLRGAYRMESLIGQGGMGLVYRATDLALERAVAVKTLISADSRLAARLRHEARAMASVAHPSLATIYGAETWRGRPFIVMEFFAAGTLSDRLKKGPLPIPDTLELGIQLVSGIEHLHELGMLHRDVKPSNIGLSDNRQPKLLDFGLAKAFLPEREGGGWRAEPGTWGDLALPEQNQAEATMGATRTGRVRGTVPYLSPEVLSGGRPGVASDLWGFSVVLYESISGANPFIKPGGSARVLAPDLRDSLPDCPPEIAAFFSRTLSFEPAKRPATARELRMEMETLVG
jgi:serine/threonine protein kinase